MVWIFCQISTLLGFYLQAPGVDYPAHAHDVEEWYIVFNGHAEFHIDDKIHQAKAGNVIHIQPRAIHRIITSNLPFFAMWMRAGDLFGKYWFIGCEDFPQTGEQNELSDEKQWLYLKNKNYT